jgi:hypothetical protein
VLGRLDQSPSRVFFAGGQQVRIYGAKALKILWFVHSGVHKERPGGKTGTRAAAGE